MTNTAMIPTGNFLQFKLNSFLCIRSIIYWLDISLYKTFHTNFAPFIMSRGICHGFGRRNRSPLQRPEVKIQLGTRTFGDNPEFTIKMLVAIHFKQPESINIDPTSKWSRKSQFLASRSSEERSVDPSKMKLRERHIGPSVLH